MTERNDHGMRNPNNSVWVCIDHIEGDVMSGRMYHCYDLEPQPFNNQLDLLRRMEALFDRLRFPQSSTKPRSMKKVKEIFTRPEEVYPMQNEQDLKYQIGNQASFIVKVTGRENATWQGQVTWTDKGVTKYFRSALELLKLMDSALEEEK